MSRRQCLRPKGDDLRGEKAKQSMKPPSKRHVFAQHISQLSFIVAHEHLEIEKKRDCLN